MRTLTFCVLLLGDLELLDLSSVRELSSEGRRRVRVHNLLALVRACLNPDTAHDTPSEPASPGRCSIRAIVHRRPKWQPAQSPARCSVAESSGSVQVCR